MKMAILHLIRSLDPALGGPVEYLKRVAIAQKEMGVHASILTLDRPEPAWIRNLPVSVLECGHSRGTYGFNSSLERKLCEISGSFDAVVVHGLWQFHGVCAARAAQKTGTPYFVFPHGMLDPWFRRSAPVKHFKKQLYWILIERKILEGARRVLFTSLKESHQARVTFWPHANYQHRIVPLGVPDAPADVESLREIFFKRFAHLRQRSFLLFLGRLHPKKGCDMLIQAMDKLNSPIDLVMAGPSGDPAFRAKLQKAAKGVSVTFAGMVEGELKAGALASADALILPSHHENFGLVVAEALSFGTPVLLSRQVNIAEDVELAGAGFVESDTLEGTKRLIERWLQSGNTSMRQAALACYQSFFSIESSAGELLRVFTEDG
jgi:glycosyltransferase involved in cell wall biosynthesis